MNTPLPLYEPTKVKFFFSVLYHECFGNTQKLVDLLRISFPSLNIDTQLYFPLHNPLLNYYAKQMGEEELKLRRFFCVSQNTLERDVLTSLKKTSLELERSHFLPFRCLNIDPGYVALEQVVLSTHKPFSHRMYLQQGIFAELEYLYQNQQWQELPWTYPDYTDPEKKQYFMAIRRSML